MTLGKAFSIRLRALLKERNMSLHKFAIDACIPRSTLVNIEKGNTKSPTLALIYQVCNAFNITPIQFLDDPIFKRDDIDFY